MRLDEKGLEAAARAVHASTAFQPAAGPWTGSLQVSEKQAVAAAKAAVEGYLSALPAEPVAWLDDGTLRAGSERTAHRVITDQQKRDMPNAVRNSFNTPLFTTPMPATVSEEAERKFKRGDRVTKTKGSSWTGRVVGFYSTDLTPIGYCVESENEPGSVQIYPESALETALAAGGRG